MLEGEKQFKLRQTEVNSAGYASYERVEVNDIDEFLEGAKAVTRYIANQTVERTEGVREALSDKSLTKKQRKALSEAIAVAIAVASPNFVDASVPIENNPNVEYEKLNEENNDYVVRVNLNKMTAVASDVVDTVSEKVESVFSNDVETYSIDDTFNASTTFKQQVENYQTNIEAKERSSGELSLLNRRWNSPSSPGSEKTKLQYLHENLSFSDGVHPVAQEIFKRYAAGQCSTESGVANVESPAEAKGYFQFLESTWKELGGDVSKIGIFEEDVKMYREMLEHSYAEFESGIQNRAYLNDKDQLDYETRPYGKEAFHELRRGLSVEDFEVFKALVVLVNYNQGANRGFEAIAVGVRDLGVVSSNPYDLIAAYVAHAKDEKAGLLSKFGPDGEGYVKKIVSYAHMFQDGARKTEAVHLAQR